MRHLDNGAMAIDNKHPERQIKSWAMARQAWIFVGSELAGQRAAIVMSLVQSARMNGHNPSAYSSIAGSRSCCPIGGSRLHTDRLTRSRWVGWTLTKLDAIGRYVRLLQGARLTPH